LFTGKEKDSTGLYYYGARYYDPGVGRFLTRDPLGGTIAVPQTLSRYTYCVNNPVKYIDPTGLWFAPVDNFPDEEEGKNSSQEESKKVETISPHDFENGKYFENEDGNGFIYLESDIQKCGNVGVAVATLHLPDDPHAVDTDHGLVIITFDDTGNVQNVKFISFKDLLGSEASLDTLVQELNREGLVDDFDTALIALHDWIFEEKGGVGASLIITGSGGAVAIASFGAKCVALGILGLGVAIGGGYYLARGTHWDMTMQNIFKLIIQVKDKKGSLNP
jgi:RHS repeat-associated protein